MCNCAAPNGANYDSYNNAVAQCGSYPSGAAGFASCVTNALGFVSVMTTYDEKTFSLGKFINY